MKLDEVGGNCFYRLTGLWITSKVQYCFIRVNLNHCCRSHLGGCCRVKANKWLTRWEGSVQPKIGCPSVIKHDNGKSPPYKWALQWVNHLLYPVHFPLPWLFTRGETSGNRQLSATVWCSFRFLVFSCNFPKCSIANHLACLQNIEYFNGENDEKLWDLDVFTRCTKFSDKPKWAPLFIIILPIKMEFS